MANPARRMQIDDAVDVSRQADDEIGEGVPGVSLLADEAGGLSGIEGEATRHATAGASDKADERELMISIGAAKFEAVSSVHPVHGVTQNDGVVDVLRIGVLAQAGIGAVDKNEARESWARCVGKTNGSTPIRILAHRLGLTVVIGAVCPKRHFVDQRRSEVPIPADAQQLAEVITDGTATVDRWGKVEAVALIGVFTRTPEPPELLLRAEILINSNAVVGIGDGVGGVEDIVGSGAGKVRFRNELENIPCHHADSAVGNLVIGERRPALICRASVLLGQGIKNLAEEHGTVGAGICDAGDLCAQETGEIEKLLVVAANRRGRNGAGDGGSGIVAKLL